jgi:hypothetical protein
MAEATESVSECGFTKDAHPSIANAAKRLYQGVVRSIVLQKHIDESNANWELEAPSLRTALQKWHPLVFEGVWTPMGTSYTPDELNILRWCTFEAVQRALRQDQTIPDIERASVEVLHEFDGVLHSRTLDLQFIGEVVGLYLPLGVKDPIRFEEEPSLELTPLSDQVIEKYRLSPVQHLWGLPRLVGSFAISAKSRIPIQFGKRTIEAEAVDAYDRFTHIHTLLLALQVTHPSAIGVPKIIQVPGRFAPIALGTHRSTFGEMPYSSPSVLNIGFLERIREIYLGLRNAPHDSMRLACSRLGLSRLRLRPEDALLDAAIGLESILLSHCDRTELAYQFSLNYALLSADIKTRAQRYSAAHAIYGLRSKIAHGTHLERKDLTMSDPSGDLRLIARRCQEMLEECIELFRADMSNPAFAHSNYWKRRALGVDTLGDLPVRV